jgi:hypothetical protein
MNKHLYLNAIFAGLIAFGAASARAAEMTAFQLVKEGNRYVSEEAQDQVVEIRSEKSVTGMVPAVWNIVYYDHDTTFHATEVKFGGGKKMEVKHPMRLIESTTRDATRLDRKKLNIDSDKALSIAMKDPLLKGLTLKASRMWLEHSDEGPRWRVRLWAASLRESKDKDKEDVDIGEVFILSEDGNVVQRDLHIDRVN